MQSATIKEFTAKQPQDHYDPSIAFGLPPLGLDWKPETIKRVCCEAALTPGLLQPQDSIWFTSPRIGLNGEPETIKRICCEAALTPRTSMTPA